MSVAHGRITIAEERSLSAVLVDLGVNPCRRQCVDAEDSPSAYRERRVVIDIQANGDFTVYSDPDIQIICRCAHVPEDEFVEVGHRPIPEGWLDRPVGHAGDGSVADLLAEVVADWPAGDPA